MKKTLIATSLAVALLSGCSALGSSDAVSYKELQEEGKTLMLASNAEGYSASSIQDFEKVRLAVNSAFLVSQPIYERYTETLMSSPTVGNFLSATEAVDTEEEKQAIYDALPTEQKKEVDDFLNSSVVKEAMGGLKEVASVILKNSATFLAVDTSSILAQVDWSDLMGEKDRIAHTYDQVTYLDSTIVSAYTNYQMISGLSNAE